MAWHTLNEAVKLTGRSRRSLYRDMGKGLVSYGIDAFGNRQFDTSELIRAYGSLASVAQVGTPSLAHPGTDRNWDFLLEELQALRQEVKDLKATVLLLEHKPDSKPEKGAQPPQASPTKPASWASLLDALD